MEQGSRKRPEHLVKIAEEQYRSDTGYTMQREDGLTPNGNQLNQRWVLRDPAGRFVDFDKYRSDLAERNNFTT